MIPMYQRAAPWVGWGSVYKLRYHIVGMTTEGGEVIL